MLVERDRKMQILLLVKCNANYPENVLTILTDVLQDLEMELLEYRRADLRENQIQDIKKMIIELDFNNPDRQVLKRVLVGMSVAVKRCSTVTIHKGPTQSVIEGYLPRLTQLASLVVFLLPKSRSNTGCLLEIGTGEGKSCILAMLATIHAIRGVKVDIVTSSPVLARRDLEEWSELYKMFGITSSAVPPMMNDVSSEKQDEMTQEAYKQQIIYSTVGTFAADTLKQEFEKKTTRGDRRFELVIVDEVDYMTLDNGVQITFLSHECSGLQHLEQVLAGIWAMISACRPVEIEETGETMWTTRIQNFHTAALIAMIGAEQSDGFSPLEILLPGIELGFYSEEDFENLKVSINAEGEAEHGTIENEALKTIMAKTGIEQQYDLLSVLEMGMEHKVAFNCYIYQSETGKAVQFGEQKAKTDQNINMLLLQNGKTCEILSEEMLVEATISQIKSKIKYSKQCSLKMEKGTLVIPSFLEKYLENQLPLFVENALKAIQMTKGREYMIERSLSAQGVDVREDEQHMYHGIIPVDFQASGMLEKRKRWGDGLQQFLEMKHQLTLSPLSNVTNYMSNSYFFKRYLSGKGIFGVSGTLGGDADKGFLARHYKTESYIIPAHQRQKVTELPAVQVRGGTEQWIQTLCVTVSKVSDRGQVVLVVCEDVNTANDLKEKITAETKHSVTMYTMSESHNIENQKFNKGQIIITTNLGGRGTDIKVTEEVDRCGGLFVLLTYFPNNRRVEKQVFGRTGRKGTPGMVQLILNQDRLAMAYRGHSIESMRELREEYEVNRIKDMEKEKLAEIEMKEKLFSTFCQFLCDFDQHYSTEEKTDLFEVKVKDVPRYFESFNNKMDYHPALNALKESWGMWLILHTEQINIENDLNKLNKNLLQHLQDTSNKLLQGQSENFYDHVQVALGRTALHFLNKNKNDYGAKGYWEKASDSDTYYRAAALYNQAYITINLAKDGYKNEARSLLEQAEEAIDVYVSETSNILSFCSLSVTRDFDPHHSGSCNFHLQMQARMNILNSWKQNITKILDMLKSDKGEFKTVDLTLYSLSTEEDFVSSSELNVFRNYGLALVFEVKKKPQFSFDALICCFLGLAQVVAGVLVCALSAGSLSSFGLGLISEGVSDMISGVMGMINGTFDWASWAISKAISLGMSLVCGGFSVLKRSFSSVKNAVTSIYNGTKSLKSVAFTAIRSGKKF
ncbi:protein translocase subunit SecA-like isoform X1 [Silurus meridionalis]|uniref:protein translocase subunit SecA-like isoform X1 n=1 Tax=Silurus meridionalis TaxID=175797 RepID=UPI001EECDFD8|nr:protein translocase subunit SecA-like isoform X1 [Silurus meridionalis]XP_046708344.1 protein translocase subunit SecA-like isoform X1 [Silurus meridionalis]XP_046708345.1 protein translocase subunit SecA-like isoform X1 [Silurus meridionalis]